MSEPIRTAAEIINAILTVTLSAAERASILRALRDTTPDLVPDDPHLRGGIISAQSVSPEYVDSTISGLESSELWQRSANSTPKDLRRHREIVGEQREVFEIAQAYADTLQSNMRYHHFVAVDKARAAHRVGNQLTGDARLSIKSHLDRMTDARPDIGRRKKKSDSPANNPQK